MTQPTPSRQTLCELFDYDEWSGSFTWKNPTGPRVKVGDSVGNLGNNGYIQVKLFNKRYLAHRLIYKMMTGDEPIEIDHINNNRTDNRWVNLRNVTHSTNQLNRIDSKRNGEIRYRNRRQLKTPEVI